MRNAYKRNLTILKTEPDVYWREVEGKIMMSTFFRYHVSGDIPDMDYLMHMVQIAERNKHCNCLCFTKKYEMINSYLSKLQENGSDPVFPANLHIIMSGWKGIKMDNPFHLPEAHVLYRDGTTTASPEAKECSGNCTHCAITDSGCWTLKRGEQIVFKEH